MIRVITIFLVFIAVAAPSFVPSFYVLGLRQSYNAQDYGWACNGTDRSTEALALLTAVASSGGGTIFFPPCASTYRADSQLFIPNNGASPRPYQTNIRLTGGGGGLNWFSGVAIGIANATTLDLRYQGTGGKIETRGAGALVIDNLTLTDGGSLNSTPLIHTTNTVLTIRGVNFIGVGSATQDGIVLGGTQTAVSGGVDAPFQGYGTIIDGNFFTKLNRGVYGRTYANNVVVTGNAWTGNTGTRAMEFDGSAGAASGNFGLYVAGNLIEMDTYTYGIVLNAVQESVFVGNGFWDRGASQVADFYFTATSFYNTFVLGYHGAVAKVFGGDSSSQNYSTVISALSGIKLIPSTAAKAPLNLPIGTCPTSPTDGDICYDGTNVKIRTGGTTKTFTMQ